MTVRVRLPITQACRDEEFLTTGRRLKRWVTLMVPTTRIKRDARAVLFRLEREQAPTAPTRMSRSSGATRQPIIVFDVPHPPAAWGSDSASEVWESDIVPRTRAQWNRLIMSFAAYRRRHEEQRAAANEMTQDTQNTQSERTG